MRLSVKQTVPKKNAVNFCFMEKSSLCDGSYIALRTFRKLINNLM